MRESRRPPTVFAVLRPVRSLVGYLPGIRSGTPRRNVLLFSLYALVVALVIVGF